MPTLTDAIEKLTPFSTHDGVPELLNDLAELENEMTDNKMEDLRKKLTHFLSSEPAFNARRMPEALLERFAFFNFFQNKNHSVFDAAYNTLLALAELKPLNDTDPITWTEITPKNKIFTSTGHQFDIITLISFNNQRVLKPLEVNRPILNIMTNKPFSPRDTAHIQDVIQQRVNRLGNVSSLQEIQSKKRSLLFCSVFALLIAPGNWFNKDAPNGKAVAVVLLFMSFLLCATSLSIANPKEIEEEPLLNYKLK